MSTIIGQGIGIPFSRVLGGIDQQAQAYYDRVIADGGIVPLGLPALSDYFKAVKAARGQSDINNCFLSQYWAGFGIKTAAGVGATAGGRACEKLYNLIGTTNDAIQTSPANQLLALVHTGENYVYLPGVAGNFFSTPNAAANQLTGDLDLRLNIEGGTWAGERGLISKYNFSANNNQFAFVVNSTGNLRIYISADGTSNSSFISTATIANNYNGWVRVTRVSSTGVITYFTSLDGVNWVQLGNTGALFTGSLFNGSSVLEIGSYNAGGSGFGIGINVKYASISGTIGGAPTQIFNPANYNRATSQTTWTSTTGEVWTLNTAATNNGLKAAIVDQTMIMGNGTSYGLRAANLNINQTAITSYTAFRKFVNTAGGQIIAELSSSIALNQGFYSLINESANTEWTAIRANVGLYGNSFNSNSLNLKMTTKVFNINNLNEASPYLINNISQSLAANIFNNNNTAEMNGTAYNLLARNNAASTWANAILIGDSICAGEDSAGVRTAMWDIYKSLIKVA